MINNDKVRNVQKKFPVIEGLPNGETLGKIRLKNLYPKWNGENVNEITQKHKKNPYLVRIGTPNIDNALKNDRIYFISHYLSFNPMSQEIETRDIISRRVTNKMYIGQTSLEMEYKDCSLFVADSMMTKDIYLTASDQLRHTSLTRHVLQLMEKVDRLSKEVIQLKAKLKTRPIYTKDS